MKEYDNTQQLKTEIEDYIEYYNYNRIKLNLNRMSPIEYRAHHNNKSNS